MLTEHLDVQNFRNVQTFDKIAKVVRQIIIKSLTKITVQLKISHFCP